MTEDAVADELKAEQADAKAHPEKWVKRVGSDANTGSKDTKTG